MELLPKQQVSNKWIYVWLSIAGLSIYTWIDHTQDLGWLMSFFAYMTLAFFEWAEQGRRKLANLIIDRINGESNEPKQ